MPLLNYTTTVAVTKTVAEIQAVLVKAGARSILAHFNDQGQPTGVAFTIETAFGTRAFTLPVNAEKVHLVLRRDRGVAPRYKDRAHADRVAWRILKDWVEAQAAIVATEMVSLEQVMLPYMHGDNGRTVFELFQDRQLALPAGEAVPT